MVERYSEWDKYKSRTFKRLPWWRKHSNILIKGSIGVIFLFTFGKIYKLLWFPPSDIKLRTLDPRWGEDQTYIVDKLKQREKALAKDFVKEDPSLVSK